MQRSGRLPLAAVSTAEVITVFGTGKPAAGRAASAAHDAAGATGPLLIDVPVVAKPVH